MQTRFIHFADIHLGYQQYNLSARFDDFGRAFLHVVDDAIRRRVDFVLLGGDLFHRRSVEPLALEQAIVGLQRLREANIPVVAVEGNHERPHYREEIGWLDFLDRQGYLVLLNPQIEEGQMRLALHSQGEGGAYVDIKGIRIYGMKYYGAATGRVLEILPKALAEVGSAGVEYSIVLLHGGLEGILPHASGVVDHSQLVPLRKYVQYLALGHLHKPFERDDWIYNPGSLETVSIDETQWPERGYYFVEVDTSRKPEHRAQLISCPRRSFVRLSQDVSQFKAPQHLFGAIGKLAAREARQKLDRPVVELELHGVLAFDRAEVDQQHMQEIVAQAFEPLTVWVKNTTVPTEFEVASGAAGESRLELEHRVLKELFERDARYRLASDDWAALAVQVKQMALGDTAPAAIVDHLRRKRVELLSEEA